MWEVTLKIHVTRIFKVFSNLMELQEANVSVKQHCRSGIGFFGRGLRICGIPASVFNGNLVIDVHSEKCTQIHSLDACHSTLSRCAQHISSVGTSHWLKVQRVRVIHIAPTLILSCDVFVERPVSSFSTYVVLDLCSVLKTLSVHHIHCKKSVQQPKRTRSLEGVWSPDRFRSKQVMSPSSPTSSATRLGSTRRFLRQRFLVHGQEERRSRHKRCAFVERQKKSPKDP